MTWVFKFLCICLQQHREEFMPHSWHNLSRSNSPPPRMLSGLLQIPMSLPSAPQYPWTTPSRHSSQHGVTEPSSLPDQDTGLSPIQTVSDFTPVPSRPEMLKIETDQAKGFCTTSGFPGRGVWMLKCWRLLFIKTIGPCS